MGWTVIFFLFFLLTNIEIGYGLNQSYPPFDLKTWERKRLKADPLNGKEAGEFQDGRLRITWMAKKSESGMVKIFYEKSLLETLKFPGEKEWADYLENIYDVDLDHNGLSDIVVQPGSAGNGLGAFYKTIFFFFQTEPGKFRRLEFKSVYFEIGDFLNLNSDGKLVLMMMQIAQLKCSDQRAHSFLVCIPYSIRDYKLVMDQKHYPSFLKFIWFTNKANDKATDKLSEKEKAEYLDTQPAIIQSTLL